MRLVLQNLKLQTSNFKLIEKQPDKAALKGFSNILRQMLTSNKQILYLKFTNVTRSLKKSFRMIPHLGGSNYFWEIFTPVEII